MKKSVDKIANSCYNSQAVMRSHGDLGVAQLVARYLGVVEAASSSLVTQTKKEIPRNLLFSLFFFDYLSFSRFLCFLACFERPSKIVDFALIFRTVT